jgi:hypothetical protein
MTGQTVAAVMLDHYGLLGNPKTPASPLRLLGAGLLIAGVLMIVQAKRLEFDEAITIGADAAVDSASPFPPSSESGDPGE